MSQYSLTKILILIFFMFTFSFEKLLNHSKAKMANGVRSKWHSTSGLEVSLFFTGFCRKLPFKSLKSCRVHLHNKAYFPETDYISNVFENSYF